MTNTLAGTAALVTADGTGLGLGIAKCLAQDGCLVTICARREAILAAAVKEIGHDARFVVCDVTGQLLGINGGHSLRQGPNLDALFATTVDPQMDELMGYADDATPK